MRSTEVAVKPAHVDYVYASVTGNHVKIQLLPSTFESDGRASPRQHLTSFIFDDLVAFDAGSLALAANDAQRQQIRDIVLTHAHLDHIAGLPLFIDDLFSELTEPIRIHAARSVIDVLERDIFNWSIYPRFSELSNDFTAIIDYHELASGVSAKVRHLSIKPLNVNHNVPSTGFVISDELSTVVLTGDTAELDTFWDEVNAIDRLSAIFMECAFPNELSSLARTSFHMTPARMLAEIGKFRNAKCPIFAINLKPRFFETTRQQILSLGIDRLQIMEVGKAYEF